MTAVLATAPITDDLDDAGSADEAEAVTEVLISPVFRDGSSRRRRLLRRAGCVLAVLCVGYLVMLGVSITAVPILRTPSDTGTTRVVPAPGRTSAVAARRHPAVRAQARLSVPLMSVPDADDQDEGVVPARPTPSPVVAPTRAPQQAPPTTVVARHTHQRAATSTPKPAPVTTSATKHGVERREVGAG